MALHKFIIERDIPRIGAGEHEQLRTAAATSNDAVHQLGSDIQWIESYVAVIWAMGYRFDYRLVKLPVRDADGFPIQTNGVSSYPGLSFVGIPWMPTERSGFLIGVGEAAERIATSIAAANTVGPSAAQPGISWA